MEGNPVAKTMKNVSRVMAVLTVPFTMGFPKVLWLIFSFFHNVFCMSIFPVLFYIEIKPCTVKPMALGLMAPPPS